MRMSEKYLPVRKYRLHYIDEWNEVNKEFVALTISGIVAVLEDLKSIVPNGSAVEIQKFDDLLGDYQSDEWATNTFGTFFM